jgi:HPt (histidine-containing phosphotransfer) domain-containing protein
MRLDVILNQWVRDKQSEETLRKTGQEKAPKSENEIAGADASEKLLENAKLEGMDFAAGIKRYGSEEIYLRILRSYLTHSPGLLDRLRSPARETLPDYTVTVHGLKGASYGICADAIGKAAEELEFAAKAGEYEKVEAKNAAFIAKVEASLEQLRKLLRPGTEEKTGKPKAPEDFGL